MGNLSEPDLRRVKGMLTAIKDPIQFVQRTAICAKFESENS